MFAGISEKNRAYLDILNRTQQAPFTAEKVYEELHLPKKEASQLLTYFASKAWLSRIRRGLYITVPLGATHPKQYKANPWVIATQVFSPCYIGGWSAAEHWELTDQIFNSVVVFTTKPIRSKKLEIQGTEFILSPMYPSNVDNTKAVWINNTKIQISNPSQTIIDILNEPFIGGGIRQAADIVEEYFESKHRNDDLLLTYAQTKKNKTIYKRLGYIIEIRNIDAAELASKCQNHISTGFTLLDPSVKTQGNFNCKWNLKINVVIEK